jgi:hypothetical protein
VGKAKETCEVRLTLSFHCHVTQPAQLIQRISFVFAPAQVLLDIPHHPRKHKKRKKASLVHSSICLACTQPHHLSL